MELDQTSELWKWDEFKAILVPVQEHWLGSFVLNLLGYAIIIGPAAFFIRRWKNDPAVQAGQGPLNSFLKLIAVGESEDPIVKAEAGGQEEQTSSETIEGSAMYYVKLLICVVGLQGSYLTWGVLQERLMTKEYDGQKFTNSQFLVFMNRILAVLITGFYLSVTSQRKHRAPFYKYSFSSISNTLSSWCQYEALKFVSFPTQVLAKASKVIPVMLMGKVVSNRTYDLHEYLTAGFLSLGVGMFLLSADPSSEKFSYYRNNCSRCDYSFWDTWPSIASFLTGNQNCSVHTRFPQSR